MIHLRLCKGLSYSGVVAATRLKPDVFIDDEETAEAAVATGYFRRMEDEKIVPPPVNPTGTITKFDVMKVSELKEYAKEHEIDIAGASRKEDIIQVILETEDVAGQFAGGGVDAGEGAALPPENAGNSEASA